MAENKYLKWLSSETKSIFWHDSARREEQLESFENGAMGMTTNPFLINATLNADRAFWADRVAKPVSYTHLDVYKRQVIYMAKEILLQASKIEKSFGSNHVLLGAGFSIYKGEVMSLLGENGAGKSTLVKIITGVYDRDSGTITMDGVEFPKTFDKAYAEKNGISIIYQELSVIPRCV